jgi:hypothetical protein
MRRRDAGLAAANRAIVEHHHRFPNFGKEISSSETGDACADHANVGGGVVREG